VYRTRTTVGYDYFTLISFKVRETTREVRERINSDQTDKNVFAGDGGGGDDNGVNGRDTETLLSAAAAGDGSKGARDDITAVAGARESCCAEGDHAWRGRRREKGRTKLRSLYIFSHLENAVCA